MSVGAAVAHRDVTDATPASGGPGGGGGAGAGGRGPAGAGGDGGTTAEARQQWWRAERLMPQVLRLVTHLPLLLLVALLAALAWKAWPAIRYNGFGFFDRTVWNLGNLYAPVVTKHGVAHPPQAAYGALPLVIGTLASSAIAMVLAIPIGIGTALLVVEKLPPRLSTGVGFCLEILAGVPSVVIGLWGFLTLGPFLSHHVASVWANHIPDVPVLRFFRGPTFNGQGMLTAGVVLAIMVLPLIAATSRDAMQQTPRELREGAIALGLTPWETVAGVVLKTARPAMFGAAVLALGRALGETMAVLMVSGGAINRLPTNIYGPVSTLAAVIASQLDSAFSDTSHMSLHALAAIALTLFVIALAVNGLARLLVREGARA